ncbi:MAG: type III pantothenate kinase [Planctomycetota bacterium]
MRLLTADLGNSRLKLRAFRAREDGPAEVVGAADLRRDPGWLDEARAWLEAAVRPAGPSGAAGRGATGRIDRAALSSVASAPDAVELADVLAGFADELLRAPDAGLENRCREPNAVGRDRLYAARGALAALPGREVVVLDCGTALTVDAASPPGVFHGGAIAPGPDLLAAALGRGAAQLFEIDPAPGAPALGRDTRAALTAGVVQGLRGAAAHLAREVAREAGFERPAWVVTGGAAPLLMQPAPVLADPLELPDLVHHGLLVALGVRPPAAEPA